MTRLCGLCGKPVTQEDEQQENMILKDGSFLHLNCYLEQKNEPIESVVVCALCERPITDRKPGEKPLKIANEEVCEECYKELIGEAPKLFPDCAPAVRDPDCSYDRFPAK